MYNPCIILQVHNVKVNQSYSVRHAIRLSEINTPRNVHLPQNILVRLITYISTEDHMELNKVVVAIYTVQYCTVTVDIGHLDH